MEGVRCEPLGVWGQIALEHKMLANIGCFRCWDIRWCCVWSVWVKCWRFEPLKYSITLQRIWHNLKTFHQIPHRCGQLNSEYLRRVYETVALAGVSLPNKLLDLLLHSSLTTVPYILRRGQMHRYAKYCVPWILPFPEVPQVNCVRWLLKA